MQISFSKEPMHSCLHEVGDRNAGCIGEIEEVITTSDCLPLGNENLSKGSGCVCRQLVCEPNARVTPVGRPV